MTPTRKEFKVKKYIGFALLLSVNVSANTIDDVLKENFQNSQRNVKNTEAVCKWQDRCGFKTACEWTCLAVSTAPMNKWWKSAAVQKLGQWCGDLCAEVKECKYGYYCDAY